MGFTTPIWLWLLMPWGLVVIWVLFTRSDYASVSTTQFWDQNDQTQSSRRSIKRPPTGFVLLLLAMLCAIQAASGLTWGNPSQGQRFTLIVDRNIGSLTALQRDLNTVYQRLQSIAGINAQIDLVTVPDRAMEDLAVEKSRIRLGEIKPTAIDTSASINQIASSELARTDQQVYVVTSQALLLNNPRLHRIVSDTKIQNAGIDHFSITPGDHPQAMVKVWNNSDIRQAVLQVDDQSQTVELPIGGGWRDYYFDLKKLDVTSTARLLVEDDIAADNSAYLARRGVWPKLVAQKGLPEGLMRMIGVYSRKRPPEGDANKVHVATSLSDIPKDSPALLVPAGSGSSAGKIELNPGEKLATAVNWDQVLKQAKITPAPSGDWISIMKLDGQPVVARRESPVRQVWVGIDNPQWEARTDYVIFFTDVFDYLGASSRSYTSELAHDLDRKWSIIGTSGAGGLESGPGIYRTPEGLVAMNMTVFQPENQGNDLRPEITPQEAKIAYNLIRPMLFGTMLFAASGAICLTRTRHRLA